MTNQNENPPSVPPQITTQQGRWRLVAFFAVIFLVVLGIGFASRTYNPGGGPPATLADPAPNTEPVYLDIDANQWRSDEEFFSWRPGMTVLDLLRLSGHRPEFLGAGESAFVTSIGGVENNPATGDGWQYQVNQQAGTVSAGLQQVQPGDRVLWTYGPYE